MLFSDDLYLLKKCNFEKNRKEFINFPNCNINKSKDKVWWTCDLGHSFLRTIESFQKTNRCPYCNNRKVLRGYNDLGTTHYELLKEWDFDKNTISPYEVSHGSHKNVWWKCKLGHSYQQKIFNKTGRIKYNCPYCSNKKVLKGFNDLKTKYPKIAEQWDYTKNSVKPGEVNINSENKYWWVCEKGHSYQQSVYQKTKMNRKCLVCCNQLIVPGINDLHTKRPYISRFWDYEKNKIKPNTISPSTAKKYYWKCDKGHEWKESPSNFNEKIKKYPNSNGCYQCSCTKSSSYAEKEIVEFIKSERKNIISNDRNIISPLELDIYIPDIKMAIEYNGMYWHNDKKNDNEYHFNKWNKCYSKDIQLITIWEDDFLTDKKRIFKYVNKMINVEENLGHKLNVSYTTYKEYSYLCNLHVNSNFKISKNKYFFLKMFNNRNFYIFPLKISDEKIIIKGYVSNSKITTDIVNYLIEYIFHYLEKYEIIILLNNDTDQVIDFKNSKYHSSIEQKGLLTYYSMNGKRISFCDYEITKDKDRINRVYNSGVSLLRFIKRKYGI